MLMTDADLVNAARSGDRVAIRTIHDAYCGRLFDHCSAVLRDPDTAGEVLSETFMLAFVELHRLADPEQLEAWLFALARDQMLFRPRSPLLPPARGDIRLPSEARARALAWEAVSWFDRRERILLDLSLRQGLDGRDLAAATGTSIAHARKLSTAVAAKADRLIGAWLVAQMSDCPQLDQVAEHAFDPRVSMRRFAYHVDRCHRCRSARRELPAATDLIASVPAEREPRELRDDALERVDLVLRALEAPADAAAEEEAGYGELALVDADDFDADLAGDLMDADDGYDDESDDEGHGFYDVVTELTPPPVPLGRSGFPQSLFPERRRLVTVLAVLAVGLVVLALVFDVRGGGTYDARLLADEARSTVTTRPPAVTAPPDTTPASTIPADTTAPAVTSLATTFACIGPAQPTTEVLATVSDDSGIKSVDLVVTHDVLGSTQKQMLASGGQYRAEIGPYSEDGTISWSVRATDVDGNVGTNTGRTVGVSQSC